MQFIGRPIAAPDDPFKINVQRAPPMEMSNSATREAINKSNIVSHESSMTLKTFVLYSFAICCLLLLLNRVWTEHALEACNKTLSWETILLLTLDQVRLTINKAETKQTFNQSLSSISTCNQPGQPQKFSQWNKASKQAWKLSKIKFDENWISQLFCHAQPTSINFSLYLHCLKQLKWILYSILYNRG